MCQNAISSEKNLPVVLKNSIDQVIEQADRANEIIHSIRGFVQKDPPKHEIIHINDAVRKIMDLLSTDAREHGVSVLFNFASGLPPIAANMLQIQQVILNLAHNGTEAMMGNEPDRRQLAINTHALSGGRVGVCVHDTGYGIMPDVLEKIFEPFYTSKVEGIGMGLSISRSIVEAHGGTLTVTSNKKDGTTFHLCLPAIRRGSHK